VNFSLLTRQKVQNMLLAIAAFLTGLLIKFFSLMPIQPLGAVAGWLGRKLGPLFPRNKVAIENLRLAFPDKSDEWRREICRSMWENLFRNLTESIKISEFCDFDVATGKGELLSVINAQHALTLREDGKAGIIFTAHTGNWELLPVAAAKFGLLVSSLYRPPSFTYFARLIKTHRARTMPNLVASRPGVAFELASILDRCGHVGVLVDQKYTSRSRVRVSFFDHPADANPLVAKLARRFECPVHGARVIRKPGGRHTLELTGPVELVRDESGEIDVEAATAQIAKIVESWVREHPDQWLWIHRRWKVDY
jgi:KDO2-lipid IV(A) lauroyltransferase